MKLDYISYYSVKPFVSYSDLKEKLPISVQKRLLQGDKFNHGIYVETSLTDVIEEIDRRFNIGKKKEVAKLRLLEIDKAEIPNYTHFQICPKELEHGRDVMFDLDRPKCKSETCPWGSRINSEITIKLKSLKRLGVAQIGRLWSIRQEYIISSEVKTLFESERVTGLEYKPCFNEGGNVSSGPDNADAYFATIVPETNELADDVTLKTYCKKHNIILNYEAFNIRFPKKSVLGSDFQLITKLKVGRKVYTYYKGRPIISKKVLELLIKYKVSGLKPYGYVLGQKFLPFIID